MTKTKSIIWQLVLSLATIFLMFGTLLQQMNSDLGPVLYLNNIAEMMLFIFYSLGAFIILPTLLVLLLMRKEQNNIKLKKAIRFFMYLGIMAVGISLLSHVITIFAFDFDYLKLDLKYSGKIAVSIKAAISILLYILPATMLYGAVKLNTKHT